MLDSVRAKRKNKNNLIYHLLIVLLFVRRNQSTNRKIQSIVHSIKLPVLKNFLVQAFEVHFYTVWRVTLNLLAIACLLIFFKRFWTLYSKTIFAFFPSLIPFPINTVLWVSDLSNHFHIHWISDILYHYVRKVSPHRYTPSYPLS